MKKVWTQQEIEYIMLHYPHERTDAIAKYLNLPVIQIYGKADRLGIKKTDEFKASPDSGMLIKGCGIGKEFRFKKGNTAFNKGKKQNEYMDTKSIEKTKKTWFKEGIIPANSKHDGAITLRKNKNTGQAYFIRVGPSNWISLSRKIWEDKNGSIPKGGMIRMKDGDPLNCEPENLELITKKENMLKNSITMYPPELIPIVKMNVKLKKQIKEYENNNHA